jgi:PAS domain S-box-containing protein
VRRKDGSIFFADISGGTLELSGKIYMIGVFRDITRRRKFEDALRESEERLEDIVFSMADWMWEVDKNGVYTYSSQRGSDILGWQPEEIIGKTPFDFMSPDEAKRVGAIFAKLAVHKAAIRDLENWNICKNGKRVCLLTNGVPIVGKEGNLKGYRGVDKDITERKQALELLNFTKAKLELALQSAAMGVWQLYIEEGRHFFDNQTCYLLGIDPGTFRGSPEEFFTPVHPEDREKLRAALEGTIKQDVPYEVVYRVVWPDKSTHYIAARGRLVKDYHNSPKMINGIIWEVTESRRMAMREQLLSEILEELNRPGEAKDTVAVIMRLIKRDFNFEAVGLRLREGEDFPYYMTHGFSKDFAGKERYLCRRDDKGNMVRDLTGNPYLECMCGSIISGRTDARLPFFTKNGSFWTNSTTDFLASTTEKDRPAGFRGRCLSEGYESLALIPLRSGDEIIGLLQLNDRRRNMFTLELIEFFEKVGASIGVSLSRKKAREALVKSEERFRMLVEQAPEAILVYDLELNLFVEANKEAETLFGCSREELLKLGWEHFYSPNQPDGHSPQESFQEHRKQIMDGMALKFERAIRIAGGEELFCEVHLVRLPSLDHNLVRASYIDITERRKAAQVLSKSQEKYQELFDNANDSIFTIDLTGKFGSFNHATAQSLGYSNEEFSRLSLQDCLTPGSYAAAVQMIKKAVAERSDLKEFQPWSFGMVRKDGTLLDFDVRTRLIWENGQITGFQGISRDVTERNKMEDALKTSEMMFKGIATASPVGLGISVDRTIQWVNDHLLKMVGREKEEIVGHGSRLFYADDETYNSTGTEFYAQLKEKGNAEMETRWQHKNGDILHIFLTGVAAFDQKNQSPRIVFTATDITGRRRIEEEMQKRLHELEVFYKASIGREERILELKKKIGMLRKELGQ